MSAENLQLNSPAVLHVSTLALHITLAIHIAFVDVVFGFKIEIPQAAEVFIPASYGYTLVPHSLSAM